MIKTFLSEPTIIYCEKATDLLVKRPFYAISNIPFFISGLLILINGKNSKLSKQFGITSFAIGLFSLIYDWSYTYISQLFDLTGMLIFINLLLYLNLSRLFNSKRLIQTQSIVTAIGIILIILFQKFTGDLVFGIFVLLVVISEISLIKKKIHQHPTKWIVPFCIFVIGFMIWILDAKHIYCAELGLLNGRAIFHYLNAIVIYQLYQFYKLQDKL